ncbi:hypothetical protein SEA_WEASELS2_148 [Rhodococcus phage Weasels2]|uniref:Uncharacterized protein n=1 Tax=Rhodococcus phage Weasels2 TaxID=1897437 RepID=A0A1I9SAC2_9CAUD|nr:hypothetical protein FDH04_gp266 [Rhodococcus phage Weasels2]AOZ63728.1 hypothetical protein SEA_WEASELS2_148 [Rhodococcus phage Weasels2]
MLVDLKRNFITTNDSRSPATDQEKVAFILEAANLGYAVPFEAIAKVSNANLLNVLNNMKTFKGVGKDWTPFYPNFPRQVQLASGWELFLNAFIHYGSMAFGRDIRPDYPVEIRRKLEVVSEDLTLLTLVEEEELLTSEIETLQNKVSLSAEDFVSITNAIVQYGINKSVKLIDGFKFDNKENWIQSLKILIDLEVPVYKVEAIAYKEAKTATDLLRAIFMLYSDENVHIDLTAKNKKVYLKSIPRASRQLIIENIDSSDYNMDDFFIHRKLWKIVDRKIHPGDYSNFTNALNAFDIVRGTVKYKTFNSRVESAIASGNAADIASLLKTRPGVFARRLDHALRSVDADGQKTIAEAFGSVATKISTPVLISLYNGIINRDNTASVIRTKSGQTANVTNVKASIHDVIVFAIGEIILAALSASYADRDPMGKVYVSPDLKNFSAPLQQRTVSSGRVLPRGSRVPMEIEGTLRFFIHWYNMDEAYGRVDLDMDAIFLDDNLVVQDFVSYHRLRNTYSTHSGDITNAPLPSGAAEFVDVDVAKAKRQGVRYVLMNINSFTGQKFDQVENFAGYMVRNGDPQDGEIFDPKTVKSAFSISSPTGNAMPGVFDLEAGLFVWLDTSLGNAGVGFNARQGSTELAETLRLELDKQSLTVYDVITANAKARGILVEKDDADVIYDLETLDIYDSNGFINKFL